MLERFTKYVRRLPVGGKHLSRMIRKATKVEAVAEPVGQQVATPIATSGESADMGALDECLYEKVYERHAQQLPEEESIGAGNFDLIGRMELHILREAGLREHQVLLDFGCGMGRLAVHAVAYLNQGSYFGSDISDSMLLGTRRRLSRELPSASCKVELIKQRLGGFDLPDQCVDMVCAFSVFTHMEHEDTYRYLVDARRVVRDGGRFVFSCLPMELAYAREVFRLSADLPLSARWSRVRDVTTSVELMNEISRLAGWRPVKWHAGDVPIFSLPNGEAHALGQSVCVLEKL